MVQVVDEQDNLVGHKKRDEVAYDTDIYRSSALWIVNSKGEVLLAQRKLTKDRDPGMWGPSVAGTVEEGETYESNAYKEAEEEVGLTGYAFTQLDKIKIDDARHQFMQWYVVEVNEPAEFFTPQPEEVEQVAWINIDELQNDVQQNPQKYIPYMKLCLDVLHRGLTQIGETK
jgi:isopentenyl-diphosphate Delta-isomerase